MPATPQQTSVDLDHLQLGDQPEQIERGLAEAVAATLAGLVIRDASSATGRSRCAARRDRAGRAGARRCRRCARRRVPDRGSLDPEHLAPLALQHQPAAGRVATIVAPVARVRRQPGHECAHVAPRAGSNAAVRLQRQPAAALRRHDHAEAVVLEHLDGHPGDAGLVVVGRAAVEVDDGASRLAGGGDGAAPTTGTVREKPGSAASRWMPSVASTARRPTRVSR